MSRMLESQISRLAADLDTETLSRSWCLCDIKQCYFSSKGVS